VYVTGTGANDVIIINSNPTAPSTATVTVQPCQDAARTISLGVPFTYTVDLGRGLVVETGVGNDQVVIDARIKTNVDIQEEGANGTIEVDAHGILQAAQYLPSSALVTGLDGSQSLGGQILAGATQISFEGFSPSDPLGSVILSGFTHGVTVTPTGSADQLTVDSPSAVQDRISGFVDDQAITMPHKKTTVAITPVTITASPTWTLDTGVFNHKSLADSVDVNALASGMAATIRTGAGNDQIRVSPSVGNLDLIKSTLSVDGGGGADTLIINDANAPTTSSPNPNLYFLTNSSLIRDSIAPSTGQGIFTTINYTNVGNSAQPGTLTVNGQLHNVVDWLIGSTSGGVFTHLVSGQATNSFFAGANNSNLDDTQGVLQITGNGTNSSLLVDDTMNPNNTLQASYGFSDRPLGVHALQRVSLQLAAPNPPVVIPHIAIVLFDHLSTVTLDAAAHTTDAFTFSAIPTDTQGNLVGGTASNTLATTLADTTTLHDWKITGPNVGTVDGTISFKGVQSLAGGDGPDRFEFMPGGSLSGGISGGPDNVPSNFDTLDYSAERLTTGVNVNLGNGSATFVGNGAANLVTHVPNVIGTPQADHIVGDNNANVLAGGGGNDTIDGGPGNDILIGGGNLDTLTGGTGDNIFITGDLIFTGTAASPTVIDLGLELLEGAMNEWNQATVSFATRKAHLTGTSGGKNGAVFLLLNSTVLDDHAADVVTDLASNSNNWLVN
jgi:hypothetical protein